MKITTTAIAALTAMFVGGCTASTGSTAVHSAPVSPATTTSTAAAQPAAARGAEGSIESIPWSQVGPGWMLATWSPVSGTRPGEDPPAGEPTRDVAKTTLYLVDPAGGRYPITTFPPPGDRAGPELVDWSGDGSKALFHTAGDPATATVVDLHTGKQTTVTVDGYPRFTRPDGKALLLSHDRMSETPATLERVDLAGQPQLTYPTDKLKNEYNGRFLSTPDGTRLVLGTASGLALMGNDGTVGAPLPVPGQADCSPVRWWDEDPGTTVLARCTTSDSWYTSRLWRVPIDGGAPTALTAPNNGNNRGRDLGDVNAWNLPAGTFVQALGPCGVIYLAKLADDGTTTPVSVPQVNDAKSIEVIGVDGDALDLQAQAACGGGQSLLRFDPAADTTTVLLGPPVNGGGVIDVVPYEGQR
jgi:hypothetical protein